MHLLLLLLLVVLVLVCAFIHSNAMKRHAVPAVSFCSYRTELQDTYCKKLPLDEVIHILNDVRSYFSSSRSAITTKGAGVHDA